jgi:hypothetical protein
MSASEAGDGGRAEPIDVDYEPAERPAPRSRNSARRPAGISPGAALVLAAATAVVGAAGGAIAPRLASVDAALDRVAPDTQAPADLAQVQSADAALNERLARVEQFVAAPLAQTAGADGVAVGAQFLAVQGAIASIQGRLDTLPSNEQVNALTGEVQALRAEVPGLSQRLEQAEAAARASFALAAAAEAAQASGGFVDAHAALAALLPADENVAALAPLAQTGAPTRIELRNRFSGLDMEIVRASLQGQAGAGLWGRVQSAASQWVTVRRVGQSNSTAGVVELAAARLAADDLAGAVAQVERLRGAAAQTAAPWLADARRRLEIENRLAAVRASLATLG